MTDALTRGRSIEDVLAGRIRFRLGGQQFELPVRTVAANREWREQLDARLESFSAASVKAGDDMGEVLAAFAPSTDELIDMLISYDEEHKLPSKAEIEAVARPVEILRAIAEVSLAAFPLLGAGLALLASETPVTEVIPTTPPSRRTSSSRRPTGGTSPTSNPA